MPRRALLPRSTPAASGVSARSVTALLDRLEAGSVECHSIMVVRHGHVVAEGWWSPYTARRPHLLYSLTKSFTSVAVGLAVTDGLLSLDDRVVDVLPDHLPPDVSEQARRLTVHHLLTMTTGHRPDSLAEAWEREPDDLVRGFLRAAMPDTEGTRHTYDNSTTFVLARMVERVTGRDLPTWLDDRLFTPMGIEHAEWDRVASGAAFGFHGLHLTTEAVAAFGELLLRGGRWGDRQLVPREWVDLATTKHVDSTPYKDDGSDDADFACGYGYQLWMSRHGFHGNGAFGQQCVVVPSHDLVVAVTAEGEAQEVLDALWECLLPGMDAAGDPKEDDALADRLRQLSLAPVTGSRVGRTVEATIDASAEDSALPDGTAVVLEPVDGGWVLRLGPDLVVEVGHGTWRESSPLGRPVVASGAWQGRTFVAHLCVITTPHRVRLVVDADAGTAVATWSTVPLTSPRLELHLRSPLMTRPDVA
ncbi:serine hydrolase [Cellulomonas sp. Leaf334]|uniref:serine hydrolase domain-containing protein n=1 Tax=Cellulomonas sp. Leaf334 TaxID=1736339 RepID=UPI0006FAAE80|nr:serine hydrolase [Cellulomonas sp. Leaf334]KQR08623.1 serine hydrolase [Cellulomonas sp. Leaf334]